MELNCKHLCGKRCNLFGSTKCIELRWFNSRPCLVKEPLSWPRLTEGKTRHQKKPR